MPADYTPLAALPPDADAEASLALLGVSLEQIQAELAYRRQQKLDKCLREMAQAAKVGGERLTLQGDSDGGGEVTMMIHPTSYHYWGQRLGYECWEDPGFRREYLRDNEAARVRSRARQLTIVKPDGGPSFQHSAPNRAAFSPVRRLRGGRWAA